METKHCARCSIRVGEKTFMVKSYKKWRFQGQEFILCPECYNAVKGTRTEKKFSKPDRVSEWYKK